MQSPGLPARSAGRAPCRPQPPWLENGPSRLSSTATSWFASGTTAFTRFVPGCWGAPLPWFWMVPASPWSSFLPIFGPVAAGEGHLEVAERRPHGLGRQAGELDPDRLRGDLGIPSSGIEQVGPQVPHGRAGEGRRYPPSPGPG